MGVYQIIILIDLLKIKRINSIMLEMLDRSWTPSPADLAKERKFIEKEIREIGENDIRKLVDVAIEFRKNSYAPYSNYNVGAGLLTTNGKTFGGCNNEYVAYSPTDHAEGVAIAKAVSEGVWKKDRKFIKAVAVVHDGDSGPCGECLQRIVEHADNCLIITANPKGDIARITSLKAIFPYNFNPSHLGR
jgi:cytidine deaminase